MKLYNLDNSPFAARVRMQIRHKQLDVEVCAPPVALRTPEFAAAYPLNKIPVLELDDGNTLGESTAIMNYLEAVYPQPPMLPVSPLAHGHNEMLVRYTDNHLATPLSPMFRELIMPTGDAEHIASLIAPLRTELEKLENLLDWLPDFSERELQTGDLCLVAHLYYVTDLTERFGAADIYAGLDQVQAWQRWVNGYAAVADEIAVIDTAHQQFLQSRAS